MMAATLFIIAATWGGVPTARELLRFDSMQHCESAKAAFQAEAPKAKLICVEGIERPKT